MYSDTSVSPRINKQGGGGFSGCLQCMQWLCAIIAITDYTRDYILATPRARAPMNLAFLCVLLPARAVSVTCGRTMPCETLACRFRNINNAYGGRL